MGQRIADTAHTRRHPGEHHLADRSLRPSTPRRGLAFWCKGFRLSRWTLRGVHVGDYGGIAPTNRDIAVESCEIYAVAAGKVVESWVYSQMTDLFDQIGEHP